MTKHLKYNSIEFSSNKSQVSKFNNVLFNPAVDENRLEPSSTSR